MLIKVLLCYIFGYIRVSIEGYYIERFINICNNKKIIIWNIKRDKNIKLYFNISINDFKKAIKIAKKLKCHTKIEKKNLSQLSKYAKEMRVYKKVTELMEVMLNG